MRKADEVISDEFDAARAYDCSITDPRVDLRDPRNSGDNISNNSNDLDDCLVN